ncbi:MAG: glycosyltransferase [Nitrospinae bacterium]|nr:glycosyltransferase [Nitrospinota bacterium]
MKRAVVFCTAPAAQTRAAADAALAGFSKEHIWFAGPDASPFAAEKNYISWGNGPFSIQSGANIWNAVRAIDAATIVLPLNNPDGEGYGLLRLFVRWIFDGEIIEHLPDGTLRTLERGAFSLLLSPEERWHAAVIALLGVARPFLGFTGDKVPRPVFPGTLDYRTIRDDSAGGVVGVSVVIRSYNEESHIGKTLEMVFSQIGFSGEVIVIDSESTDATREIALRHPVRLFSVGKRAFSYGAALNLGARLARGRIVVNLSAHAVPAHREWLTALTAPLADDTVAGVYGRELPIEGWNGHFEAKILSDAFGPKPMRSRDNPFFSNANAAMPRKLVLDLPFDEHVGWGEDGLWAREMQRRGLAIAYRPDAAVHHSHNTSMFDNFARCLKHHRTLFSTYLRGKECEVCRAFYKKLPGRAASFRRFLAEQRGMAPLKAILYAPYCEYVNWLGCDEAAREAEDKS